MYPVKYIGLSLAVGICALAYELFGIEIRPVVSEKDAMLVLVPENLFAENSVGNGEIYFKRVDENPSLDQKQAVALRDKITTLTDDTKRKKTQDMR